MGQTNFIIKQRTQVVLTGSGNYTMPAGCKQIRVRQSASGGGGGGGGTSGQTAGGAAASTTFGTAGTPGLLTCTGGAGGSQGNTGGSEPAGDTIRLVAFSNTQNTTIIASSDDASSMYIERLSGPATIAASESITAGYYVSSGAGASSTQSANFDVKLYDSHNAVTASASGTGTWKFTAPVSGVYRFYGPIFLSTIASPNVVMYKNGTAIQTAGPVISSVGNYACAIKLLAGDYVDLRLSSSLTLAGGAPGTSSSAIFIERIGN